MLLLGLGALFYHLDIQQLNGKFLPPMCKIFVLPNIWGIAGLIMLGKCLSILDLFKIDNQSASKKAVFFIISLIIVTVCIATDDHIYDFPIGKWGRFKGFSYFITPICGAALSLFCIYIANLLKSNNITKNATSFFGKNSLDFLLVHFFLIWLLLYVFGAWYPILSGAKIPLQNARQCWWNFAYVLPLTLMLNFATITLKEKLKACF